MQKDDWRRRYGELRKRMRAGDDRLPRVESASIHLTHRGLPYAVTVSAGLVGVCHSIRNGLWAQPARTLDRSLRARMASEFAYAQIERLQALRGSGPAKVQWRRTIECVRDLRTRGVA